MYPELFTIGSFTIYTYGLLLATAYLTAIALTVWRSKRLGLDSKVIVDLSIVVLIGAIVGAKLFYVLGHLPEMIDNPSRLWDVLRAGGVFQGGLIVAVILAVLFLRWKKQPVWLVADIAAPSIAIGQAIGRVGCFAAGCCYGKPADPEQVPWAVAFGEKSIGAPPGVPVHPTQLYELLLMLVVFAVLMFMWRRRSFDGQIFWSYIIMYAVVRGGIVEWFRGDHEFYFLGLSGPQYLAIAMFVIGIVAYLYFRRRAAGAATGG